MQQNPAQEKHANIIRHLCESLRVELEQIGKSRLLSIALTDLEKLELIAQKAAHEALAVPQDT